MREDTNDGPVDAASARQASAPADDAPADDAVDLAAVDPAAVDLAAVFTALPGVDLVLAPDAPRYTMLAATDGRLAATMTTREGTLGRPLFEVFPDANPANDAPSGVGNLQASLDAVLRTRAPHRMAVQRYDLQRPDGSWEERYWEPLNVPVLGPDGAVRYLVHRVEDVTAAVRLAAEGDRLRGAVAGSERARVRAEAARDEVAAAHAQLQEQALELELANQQLQEQAAELAESETRFRDVADASPDAVLLLRPVWDGRPADGTVTDFDVVYGNPAAGRMLGGGSVDALVGRRLLTVFPSSAAEGYFGAYAQVFATGMPYAREDRYARDGLDVGVRVTAVRAGALVHVRHEDIAERLRTDAERVRLLAESEAARASAEAANRAKGEFLAVMSHELRTPLNAIGGYAQLMELGLQGPVTPEQVTALGRIQRGQQHLLGLINSVLNYAKLEAGHVQYETADVPVAEALAEVAALVAPQVRAKGLTLAAGPRAPGGDALVARADPEKVRQVLLNLLSNAVKFTRGGGTVTVGCGPAGGGGPGDRRVALTVADTGRGIAADQLARVFAPFVQVDQRLTRGEEGTGLGLAISRDLARGMGGDLTAESTPGVGSTFTLTLPSA